MPSKPLTDKAIRSFSADEGYEYLWDKNFKGASFGIRASAKTGLKTFTLKFELPNGKQKTESLGHYDSSRENGITLSEARQKAFELLAKVSNGNYPQEKEDSYSTNGSFTCKQLAEKFLDQHGGKISDRTKGDYERQLNKDIIPRWGNNNVEEITTSEVNQVLDHIAYERESPVSADRTRAMLHKMFEFAKGRGIIDTNPVSGIEKRANEEDRDRYLDKQEIKTLWGVLEEESPQVKSLYKMLLLTGQRLGETKRMRWDDIDENVWTIPAEHAKNNERNRVPLSPLAQEVLEEIEPVTGDSEWVFESPSPRTENKPLMYFSNITERIREKCGFYFRNHDLRRTVATHLSKLGVNRTVIGKVLNHKEQDRNQTAIYDSHDFEEEKREAIDKWSQKLREIIEQTNTEKLNQMLQPM